MSDHETPDQEVPGRQSTPRPGGKSFDASEQLRGKLEAMRSDETDSPETADDTSKVVRLPRRPRRVAEDTGGQPRKTWQSERDNAYDSPPTRPVLRSELQRETGWWQVDPGATRYPAPVRDPGRADNDGSVVDLDVLRRKRAGEAATTGIRPLARPRRVDNSTGRKSDTDGDHGADPDSPPSDGPAGQH